MPCHVDCEDPNIEKISKLEAMLCGVIRTLQDYSDFEIGDEHVDDIIKNHFDEEKSGIKRSEVMKWYREHIKKDLARQQEEEKKKDKLRNAALKKLSKEEKEALGL